MTNKISRRRFLTLAGGAVGAAALSCGGIAVLGTRQLPVELAQESCREEAAAKILVAYASRCGSTSGVAQAIGQVMCEAGAAVDVLPVKAVRDLVLYSAAVVGSAVRIGKWLPESTQFVESHKEPLSGMPLAYFSVCMTATEEGEEARRTVEGFSESVRALVGPVDEAVFAGAVDYTRLPFVTRFLVKNLIKTPEGDFRDWDAIRDWAGSLPAKLLEA